MLKIVFIEINTNTTVPLRQSHFFDLLIYDSAPIHSCELTLESNPERIGILSKLFNTLMEFIKRHRVLKQGPTELGLVVHVGDLGDGGIFGSKGCIKLLRDWCG